jgi:LAGLIDADG DNA endonuclease family
MGSVETMNNQQKYKYVYAMTFGDGCLSYPTKNKPHHKVQARFICNHVYKNEDYVDWKKGILENITTCYKYYIKGNDFRNDQINLTTARHPIFTDIKERMYKMGRKTVDPHFKAHLDWETLAIIYQDDGCYANKEKERTIYLSLNNYSWAEQKVFRDWCAELFNMHFTINKHMGNYRLRLASKCVDEFMIGVGKYILPSFQYKLDSEVWPRKGDDIVRSA